MDNLFEKQLLYLDYSLEKRTTTEGEVKRYYNENALAQAVRIWIASSKGEKLRTRGAGWVIPFIGKPLSDDNAEKLRQNLLLGLSTDFNPKITVTTCIVYPDVERNVWVIILQGFNPDFNTGINTQILLNNQ